MADNYDPAKVPCSPGYKILPCPETLPLNGPGGNTTMIENNEKGILETNLAYYTTPRVAELQGDHNRQGVYAS